MEASAKPKLIVLFDARVNEYSLSAHNQTTEQAEQFVRELQPKLEPNCSLLTLEQLTTHKTEDAQSCKTCRETVRRRSGVTPPPKFVRRRD